MSKIDPDKIANMNEISINFECPIDLLVSLNPVMCSKCFNLYCEDCSFTFKKCPTCYSADYQMLKTTNTIVEYEINKIKVFCENKMYGCPFIGFVGDEKVHLIRCPYNVAACGESNCGLYLCVSNYSYHYTNQCNGKRLKCYICGSLEYISDITKHLKICSELHLDCMNCGLYHLKPDLDKCRFILQNCTKCNLPDIKKEIESGEHECIFNNELNSNSSSNLSQSKTFSLSTYLGSILNKVQKLLEKNLRLKEEVYQELIDHITIANISINDNLKLYAKITNNAMQGEMTGAIEAEINKIRKNKELLSKSIEDNSISQKKIRTNLETIDSQQRRALACLNNDFNLRITQKNVNLTILLDALNQSQQQSYFEDPVCASIQIENEKVEVPQIKKGACDICLADAFEDNKCNICEKQICFNSCSAILGDFTVCLRCLNCTVCGSGIDQGKGSKCFSDKCNNILCSDCFIINKHQVRTKNNDCKFTKCKECDTAGICIMTTRHCPSCTTRLCYKCYNTNHLLHNPKNR